MNKQEFNGRTLDEALSAAARALGTDVTMISYNILPQSSGGLFSKLFQRGVRLEAWVDSSNDVQAAAREAVRQAMADAQDQTKSRTTNTPGERGAPAPREQNRGGNDKRKAAQSARPQGREGQRNRPINDKPRPQNQPQRKPAQPQSVQQNADLDSIADERSQRPRFPLNSEESKALLVELAQQFTHGFDPDIGASNPRLNFINDEEVLVTIESPTLEGFLQRSDRLSCAFEHLFKRIAQRKFGDVSGRVTLDAGSAAQQREDKLKQMALDIAAKVKENGKTITLSSKSSQERRVIHLALENMEGIATKSVGVAENRKLIIYSTERPRRDENGPRRNNDNQRRRGRPQVAVEDGTLRAEGQTGGQGERSDQPRRNRRRGRRGGSRNGRQGAPRAQQNSEGSTSLSDAGEHTRDSEV